MERFLKVALGVSASGAIGSRVFTLFRGTAGYSGPCVYLELLREASQNCDSDPYVAREHSKTDSVTHLRHPSRNRHVRTLVRTLSRALKGKPEDTSTALTLIPKS